MKLNSSVQCPANDYGFFSGWLKKEKCSANIFRGNKSMNVAFHNIVLETRGWEHAANIRNSINIHNHLIPHLKKQDHIICIA